MSLGTQQLTHTGAELDKAITDWQNTLTPVYTLPGQVKFSAVCNPTVPSVNVSWVWGDTEFASGIMVRRKLGSVPQHVADGDLVCDIAGVDVVSFEDTIFDAADPGAVGTYEAPIIWYYRAFPYNINGQYQTHYQTAGEYGMKAVGVYSFGETGAVLSTLALGDTFLFGRYEENELEWRVTSIFEDRIKVTLHYDQLFTAQYDAPEPGNPVSTRAANGSNRYATSNIRQFLNARGAANDWFVPQTDTDALGSAYKNRQGFLSGFSEAEINLIVPEVLTSLVPDEDGGGTETFTDLVWIPSSEEMGWKDTNMVGESTVFDIFAGDKNTNANRIDNWAVTHWTRTRAAGTAYQARGVFNGGNAGAYNASISFSLRAGLSLPLSSFITFDEVAGKFRVQAV